jgi:nicotinamide phosphoribosyltransferase
MNPIFYIDFYKVGHVVQYAKGTQQVWSNWTARSSRTNRNSVVFVGLQYFIKKYLIEEFNKNFFGRSLQGLLNEYREVIKATLGVEYPKTDHIEYLHNLGYLPLDFYALPEGVSVPTKVPSVVVTNTDDNCYWLPNYIESVMSAILWKPSTSATTAQDYRDLFIHHAKRSGETDLSFVNWQGHDFSFRGMSGLEDAILSGMGHLTSFNGTDTLPAILAARQYYGADLSVGGSVPATEHSVMCSGGQDGEFDTFKRLITETYPTGIVSVVSDTWDLWKVLTDYVPRLKETILARDGKLVIRPDSGDPVEIICGAKTATWHSAPMATPADKGTLRLLAETLGTNLPDGCRLPLINKAGAIYGDSITLKRADQILTRTIDELKLSPYNMVFGIGSYTYEYVTRDTYGHAMKATAVRNNNQIIPIFKKPVTDDGLKTSLKGIPCVYQKEWSTSYYVIDGCKPESLDNCAFRKVFSDGRLLIDEKFDTIRKRARHE